MTTKMKAKNTRRIGVVKGCYTVIDEFVVRNMTGFTSCIYVYKILVRCKCGEEYVISANYLCESKRPNSGCRKCKNNGGRKPTPHYSVVTFCPKSKRPVKCIKLPKNDIERLGIRPHLKANKSGDAYVSVNNYENHNDWMKTAAQVLECMGCGKLFTRTSRAIRQSKKKGYEGVYCSNSCSAKYKKRKTKYNHELVIAMHNCGSSIGEIARTLTARHPTIWRIIRKWQQNNNESTPHREA